MCTYKFDVRWQQVVMAFSIPASLCKDKLTCYTLPEFKLIRVRHLQASFTLR